MHLSSPERILHRFCCPPSCPNAFSLEGAHTKVRGEGGNCNSEPIFAVRKTGNMLNSPVYPLKKPLTASQKRVKRILST